MFITLDNKDRTRVSHSRTTIPSTSEKTPHTRKPAALLQFAMLMMEKMEHDAVRWDTRPTGRTDGRTDVRLLPICRLAAALDGKPCSLVTRRRRTWLIESVKSVDEATAPSERTFVCWIWCVAAFDATPYRPTSHRCVCVVLYCALNARFELTTDLS